MAFEDSFLDELDATPTSSKESMQILQDFRDDWEKAGNNYDGWLSVQASPEDAAARTLQPVLAKWQAFAPVLRAMNAGSSRRNYLSDRDDSARRKSFTDMGSNPAVRGEEAALMAKVNSGIPFLEAVQSHPTLLQNEPFKSKWLPRYQNEIRMRDHPQQGSEIDAILQEGFSGGRPSVETAAFDEPFSDSFESPPTPQSPAAEISMPDDAFSDESGRASGRVEEAPRDAKKRVKNTLYQTPRGVLRWSGTGWTQP